jgi:hypothetical protein
LQYAHFPDLMRIDKERTENELKILFMTLTE